MRRVSGGPVVVDIRAAWQANTGYLPGDVFTYSGGAYEVTTPYTSGGSFGASDLANTTVWEAQSGTSVTVPVFKVPLNTLTLTDITTFSPMPKVLSVSPVDRVYSYAVDSGGGNIIWRSNDGWATRVTGPNFSALFGDAGAVKMFYETAEGWVAFLVTGDATNIYFRAKAAGWGTDAAWTVAKTCLAVDHIAIGQPLVLPGGNTVMTVGEYGAGTETRHLFLTQDGGQTWTTIRTHTAVDTSGTWNNHCHAAAFERDGSAYPRLWGSFGDGPNNWFGYTDTWKNATPTWVAVPALGQGPDTTGGDTYNQPTLLMPTKYRMSLTPDGSYGHIGVWAMETSAHGHRAFGQVAEAMEVAPVSAYRQWSRAPFGFSADAMEAYALFPPDGAALDKTGRFFVAGTGDGGESWHRLYVESIDISTDLPTSGIVGPDSTGRMWIGIKRGGTFHTYQTFHPRWVDRMGDPTQPKELYVPKSLVANRPAANEHIGFFFGDDQKRLYHSDGSTITEVGTPLGTNLAVAKRNAIAVAGQGIKGQNFSRELASNGFALNSGNVYAALLGFLPGDVITNVLIHTSATGATFTLVKGGVYSTALALLASSADLSSGWQAGASTSAPRVIPLSAPYTVTSEGPLYLAVIMVATTPSTLKSAPTSAATTGGASGGSAAAIVQSGQSDLPNPMVASNNTTPIWVGWS